jgi:hypothetical protein
MREYSRGLPARKLFDRLVRESMLAQGGGAAVEALDGLAGAVEGPQQTVSPGAIAASERYDSAEGQRRLDEVKAAREAAETAEIQQKA